MDVIFTLIILSGVILFFILFKISAECYYSVLILPCMGECGLEAFSIS